MTGQAISKQAAAVSTSALLESLALRKVGAGSFHAENMPTAHSMVFGGQFVAQSIVAALSGRTAMTVKTIHTAFVSPGHPDSALQVDVEGAHGSDGVVSCTVAVRQDGRARTRSLVLLAADEPDFIRHADQLELPPCPADEFDRDPDYEGRYQLDVVGGIDLADPDAAAPPELEIWTRFDGAPDDPVTNQALLAYSSMALFSGTAMRPHKGVGMALLERTVSAAILSHTVTFHEPAPAGQWVLMAQRSLYAGRGHSYGRADIFGVDGQLVASAVQDNIIRPR